jgi:hypothetical protein
MTRLPDQLITCERLSRPDALSGLTCDCDSRLVEDAHAGLAGLLAVFACLLLCGALVWAVMA